jgi:hypothetical protein
MLLKLRQKRLLRLVPVVLSSTNLTSISCVVNKLSKMANRRISTARLASDVHL